jgi:hypothetical protein
MSSGVQSHHWHSISASHKTKRTYRTQTKDERLSTLSDRYTTSEQRPSRHGSIARRKCSLMAWVPGIIHRSTSGQGRATDTLPRRTTFAFTVHPAPARSAEEDCCTSPNPKMCRFSLKPWRHIPHHPTPRKVMILHQLRLTVNFSS